MVSHNLPVLFTTHTIEISTGDEFSIDCEIWVGIDPFRKNKMEKKHITRMVNLGLSVFLIDQYSNLRYPPTEKRINQDLKRWVDTKIGEFEKFGVTRVDISILDIVKK